ncbi:aminotransferase [Lentilactobacillus fungorum]|uniref:Aminotransferase n=1 Tax=Lentilactobacillus fungorum TaxID=2201250 RepID=A0ABQ3VYP3_9LACO|nr:pyridoxal phosphate-dependent aminotransferase [Lentilactobacillus fungorum]GHP12789.1 aminotransferase [Lentilactobacillus fungorum]
MELSKRTMKLTPSATVGASNKAKQLIQSGIDVINLSIGEPDFTTPKEITDATIQAIESGKTSFYTPASGLTGLKQAIKERIKADYQVDYGLDQISVTTGAKMALYALMQVLVDPSDEVLLPRPSWVSYQQQVVLAGGVPVMVETNPQFKLTVAALEQARTSQSKVLILNSPQNPTGIIYSQAELMAIGNWAVAHDIIIIADDIYGKLIYNGNRFCSPIQLTNRIAQATIMVNGVSKAYSMTGWRIGYIAGNRDVIQKVNSLLSHTTGNPAAASQYAAIAALKSDQAEVALMRQAFEERLNTIYPLVKQIPGFEMNQKPQGAFYLFPKVTAALQLIGINSSKELADRLLTQAHVAVVDGGAFGMPGYLRLSYATDLADLKVAVTRIAGFMNQYLEKELSGGIGIGTD